MRKLSRKTRTCIKHLSVGLSSLFLSLSLFAPITLTHHDHNHIHTHEHTHRAINGKIEVSSYESLLSALNDDDVKEITLENSITLPDNAVIDGDVNKSGTRKIITAPENGTNEQGAINTNASSFVLFYVAKDATVTIKNLDILGGGNSAIVNGASTSATSNNSTLYIDHCSISRSGSKQATGGAILNTRNSKVVITYCSILRNIAHYGGALNNQRGTMVIEHSSILGNRSYQAGGGGIENTGDSSSSLTSSGEAFLYINDSTIANNASQEIGGGINNCKYAYAYIANSTIACNATTNTFGYKNVGGGIGNNNSTVVIVNGLVAGNVQLNTSNETVSNSDISNYASNGSITVEGTIYGNIEGSNTGDSIQENCYQVEDQDSLFLSSTENCVISENGEDDSIYYSQSSLVCNSEGVLYAPLATNSVAIAANGYVKLAKVNFDYSDLDNIEFSYSFEEETTDIVAGSNIGFDKDAEANELVNVKVHSNNDFEITGGTVYGDSYFVDENGKNITLKANGADSNDKSVLWYTLDKNGEYKLLSTANPYIFNTNDEPFSCINHDSMVWSSESNSYNIDIYPVTFKVNAEAGNKEVSLSWGTENKILSNDIESYKVYYSTVNNFEATSYLNFYGKVNSTETTIDSLQNGLAYYFWVIPQFKSGEVSDFIAYACATPNNGRSVYKLVDTLESGKEYIITNSNEVNNSANALVGNSNGGSIANVNIQNDNGTKYIAADNGASIWTAIISGTNIKLKSSNYYVYLGSNPLSTSSHNLSYVNNGLSYYNNWNGRKYLDLSGSAPAASSSSSKVYFYEKTSVASQEGPTGIVGTSQQFIGVDSGKITGLNTSMEYSKDAINWEKVTSTTMTNVAVGDYYFRYAETGISYASPAVCISITEKFVQSIDIKSQPTIVYCEGDELDLSSLVVDVRYNDGTYNEVPYEKFNSKSKNDYDRKSGQLTTSISNNDQIIRGHNGKSIIVSLDGKQATTKALSVSHKIVHVDAKAATCTANGNIEYWMCEYCNAIFTDSEGLNEVSISDVLTAKLEHDYQDDPHAPTCTEGGSTTHTCTHCGDSYSDSETEALGHSYVVTSSKEATCEEDGYVTYTCSDCGATYSDIISATGHNYETEVTAPTCTTKGYTTHTCSECGDSYVDSYADALGHDFQVSSSKEATCEEDGFIAYTCSHCGETYNDVIPATGHDYKTTVVAPTCTEEGYTLHTCSCGASYKDNSVEATGHSYVVTSSKEATCEEDGYVTYTCSECGVSYNDIISATGHNYETVVTDPTCTIKGYTTHTCSECGESYVDSYVDALEHDYQVSSSKEATCKEDGFITYTCSHCGDSYNNVIPATGHNYKTTVVAPTCTEEGYTLHTCNCGASYKDNSVEATGHSYVVTSSKDETCTEDGYVTYTCSDCGAIYSDIISATGHNYETVVTDPTCTTKGYTTHTCSECGDSYVDTYVDALEHDYQVSSSKEATCEEDGFIIYTCSHCGDSYNNVISATGHDYKTTVVAPTCTEEGYTLHTCNCGASYKDNSVEATGHSYVVTSSKDATCTEDGYVTYTCSDCGAIYSNIISATGHNYKAVVTNPTCTEKGYTTHTCSECGDSYVDSYVDALGHNYQISSSKEATCEEDGFIAYTCSHCGGSYNDVIPATGHSYVVTSSKDAICTEDGYVTYTCSNCGATYSDIISATGHNYEAVVTDPTCTNKGYTSHTCSGCGDSYVDSYVDALGHNYKVSSSKESTCEEDGFITYTCSHCGESYNDVIPATGHDYKGAVVAPTCTEEGYTLHTCSCGASYKDNFVEATGHSYVMTSSKDATCTEDGYVTYKCSDCGTTYNDTIYATGHNYESVVTKPTCTIFGYTTHTCSGCGNSYVDSYTDAIGHDYVVSSRVESTCEQNGFITYTCSHCGDTYSAILEAKGHYYVSTVVGPKCCEDGYTLHTCTRCGNEYRDNYTFAIGHDYRIVEKKDPTKKASGYIKYQCANCGATYSEAIPALSPIVNTNDKSDNKSGNNIILIASIIGACVIVIPVSLIITFLTIKARRVNPNVKTVHKKFHKNK